MIETSQSSLNSFYKNGSVWRQEKYDSKTVDNSILGYEDFMVKREGDKFFLCLNNETDNFIEVSEEIAKVIIVGLEAEKRIKKRKVDWEERSIIIDTESVREWDDGSFVDLDKLKEFKDKSLLYKIYSNFYCHRVVRYILGIAEETDRLKNKFSTLSGFDYKYTNSLAELKDRTKGMKFPIVGRIVEWEKVPEENSFSEDKHTFLILGVDNKGRYICFEKCGGLEYPARITTIDPIYDFYSKDFFGHTKQFAWAFQELSKVEEKIDD
jgi:hypothetical protein